MADPTGRVGILTPGPLNETYFEHAYIARYLGIMLLEGEDLTVTDGRLMVRTVSGLKPVSVLWRRMDAAFADPLELRDDWRIGTPGLAEALRHGSISMVNALGSGILETRALLAFLPQISPRAARRGARPALDRHLVVRPGRRAPARPRQSRPHDDRPGASTGLPFDDDDATVLGSTLDEAERATLLARIAADGGDFVGQEPVTLSTAPVFVDGKLEPRPITLRVYLARTADGWTVMPGGFARVGSSLDTTAIAMQRGGQAADVWVVSDKPVERDTLLPRRARRLRAACPAACPAAPPTT